MVEQLWAPWRLSYVAGPKPEGCVLCAKQHEQDDESLVVHRGRLAFVVLNLYPYTNGHLMIVPQRHVADLTELGEAESAECQRLLERSLAVLRDAMAPDGFNVGLNLGSAAGAGIEQHLHWHVVPRWNGDTNFMPVIAEVKVMPQHLHTTWQLVREGFARYTPSDEERS